MGLFVSRNQSGDISKLMMCFFFVRFFREKSDIDILFFDPFVEILVKIRVAYVKLHEILQRLGTSE